MKDLLIQARNEIVSLRRQNEIFQAQLAIVEVFAAALGLKREERGMTIDVVWTLDKEIAALESQVPPHNPVRNCGREGEN